MANLPKEDGGEIDVNFDFKNKRETESEIYGDFFNTDSYDTTDATKTDLPTTESQELTDNSNDSDNADQTTGSNTPPENEGESVASGATKIETNTIWPTTSTSKSEESEEKSDNESTGSSYKTYAVGEHEYLETSVLTKTVVTTPFDNMDTTPTESVSAEAKYTQNDEYTTISQQTKINNESLDNSALTIEDDSSKTLTEKSTREYKKETTDMNAKENTGGCEDPVTVQAFVESSDKQQETITENVIDVTSTNNDETEDHIKESTDNLERSTFLKQSIRHDFSIVQSNMLKAAESVNNVMESLRLALENTVENILNSFSNLNEKDRRNEIKSEE
ncbi:hypothetical protein ACTXT7_010809 [Hymenolepis weldensis]